jgi:DNA-binding PadR family transcriptional regulator
MPRKRIEVDAIAFAEPTGAVGLAVVAQANAARRPAKRRERTTLKTAVLAALIDQPSHGYDIAVRLNMRMGPAWNIDPKRVYEVLERFEEDGLARSIEERAPGTRSGWRRVYHATALAEVVREEWMAERQRVTLVGPHIRTWIAFARPQDGPRLLARLDEYELDCLEMLERAEEPEVRPTSWHGRAINMMRGATAEQLRAELRSIARARREIEEHLAESR